MDLKGSSATVRGDGPWRRRPSASAFALDLRLSDLCPRPLARLDGVDL
jgi:hypothetical protein